MSEQPNTATPDKVITFTADGEEREVKMTYGLLNELVNLIKEIEEVSKFFVDEKIRNAVLAAVLAQRAPNGKVTSKVNVDDIELELEAIDEILAWASAHVTGFFIRSLTNLAKRVNALPTEDIQAGLEAALTASSSGTRP